MAEGAIWMVLLKLIQRSLGLVSTIILARLLVPADFGLVAMAMSFIAILELISAFGFDMALIQNPSAERRHYDTAWTFNVLFAAVVATMIATLAVPISHFYNESRLPPILYVLAIAALVQGFENIGVVAFRKDLEFKKEFRYLLARKLASFAVTIPLAIALSNYWALVIGQLVGRCVEIALSYYVHSYRPKFSFAGRAELFHFSKWLVINNILLFVRGRSADFVIGRMNGAHALGLFSMGHEIANLPLTELVAPVNRAMYPGYAKIAGTLADVHHRYLQVTSMIALLVFPACMGLSLTADLIVPVLLGEKWLDTIVLIQIIALYGGVVALQSNMATVFLALGRPRLVTLLAFISVVVFLPLLLFLCTKAGALGAATALLGSALITMPINFSAVIRCLNSSMTQLFSVVWRPILASVAMAAVVLTTKSVYSTPLGFVPQLLQIVAVISVGVCSYVATVAILWRLARAPVGAERLVIDNFWPIIRLRLLGSR